MLYITESTVSFWHRGISCRDCDDALQIFNNKPEKFSLVSKKKRLSSLKSDQLYWHMKKADNCAYAFMNGTSWRIWGTFRTSGYEIHPDLFRVGPRLA